MKKIKTEKNIISNCCSAPVYVNGGIGDFSDYQDGVTHCYICTKCEEACDVEVVDK